MFNARQNSSVQMLALVATCFFVGPVGVAADFEASKNAFKSCIESQLTTERAKKNPTVEALLKTCNNEYRHFLKTLPLGNADEFNQFLRDDIDEQLRLKRHEQQAGNKT